MGSPGVLKFQVQVYVRQVHMYMFVHECEQIVCGSQGLCH